MAGPDPVNFEAISDVLDRFTARFSQTWEKTRQRPAANRPRWDMTLIAYPDAVSAGAQVLEDYEEVKDPETGKHLENSEWLDLCAQAGTDPAARKVVTRVFVDAHTV